MLNPLTAVVAMTPEGVIGLDGDMPDVRSLRIPVRYLANLLTLATTAANPSWRTRSPGSGANRSVAYDRC